MTLRFLFDECLWPGLVQIAREAGHHESTCVRDRGLSGTKDHDLVRFAVEGDFTLVTHNAIDFRGATGEPPGGLHADQAIHAGLVCLVSPYPMTPALQRELFDYVLAEVALLDDLVNQALEVVEAESGEVHIDRYEIPAPGGTV